MKICEVNLSPFSNYSVPWLELCMNEKGTYNLIKLSWTFYYVRSQLIVEDKRTQAYLTMEVVCLLHSYTFYKDFLLFFVFHKRLKFWRVEFEFLFSVCELCYYE